MAGLSIDVMEGQDELWLPNLSNEDYHATHWAVSSSMVRTIISQTPAHYWAKYLDPNREPQGHVEAFSLGSLFHSFVLEPDTEGSLAQQYIVYSSDINRRTKEGKQKWAELEAKSEKTGRPLISEESWNTAKDMAVQARKVPIVDNMFSGGQAEQSLFWRDPGTGLILKARPDYIRQDLNLLIDLKSCQSASREDVGKSLFNYRYDVQAVHYAAGYARHKGESPQFLFLFMEKSPPYCSAPYIIDAETLTLATKQWEHALSLLAKCIADNRWPGYPSDVTVAAMPEWAKRQIREKLNDE